MQAETIIYSVVRGVLFGYSNFDNFPKTKCESLESNRRKNNEGEEEEELTSAPRYKNPFASTNSLSCPR